MQKQEKSKNKSESKSKSKKKSKSKSKGKRKSKNKSKNKSKSKSKSKNKCKSNSKRKNKSESKSKGKARAKTKAREKQKQKRKQKQGQEQKKSKRKRKSKSRSNRKSKSKSKSKNKTKSYSKNESKTNSKSKNKGKRKSKGKIKSKNKSKSKSFVPQAEICRDKDGSLLTDNREMIERWMQRFNEHLNGEENVGTDDQGNGGFDYVSTVEDGNEPTPTLREVNDAIQHLKNNKAAGKDGIAAKLIKLGPERLATCLHRIFDAGTRNKNTRSRNQDLGSILEEEIRIPDAGYLNQDNGSSILESLS
ncbi:serine/arginine-rich splicing factor 4-like [Topomyia yanbarensis]|uniref:serine/arginine-rich splicing factor 4-like n=1 Tax=Topomyia yanbarensis TaxID=2498891 RepID=UPI00273C15E7|nr:serine/arginine-rich splicing factor 4-like [Topomyia yanbarensis]